MKTIALKFGGSSLASAEQFRKVANIVKADPDRHYVVASAPGKRNSSDTKVTDLLYKCYNEAVSSQNFEETLQTIQTRFSDIVNELGLSFDVEEEIAIIRKHLQTSPSKDYMASRGEYLNSKILAQFLNFAFIDPALYISFDRNGILDMDITDRQLGAVLRENAYAVVAGFYGAMPDGSIKTFSRGGSDITGSLVARAVNADIYENWTDVSGCLAADPRIVQNPKTIDVVSYNELRELSYMGASVLHEDATFPVRKAGIPINIRNTNRPEDNGTLICSSANQPAATQIVTGIAGKPGFTSVRIEKTMMNAQVGFVAAVLNVFADFGISIEHVPTGIDTMSLIVSSASFEPYREAILQRIKDRLEPDFVLVESDIALLAVVGSGMAYSKGIATKVTGALANAEINIRMISQGSSERNIIIGVVDKDLNNAIRAIYEAVLR